MNTQAIDDILAQTLADGRFSRAERASLRQLAEELGESAQWDAFRARAFHLAGQALHDPRDRAVLEWLEKAIKALRPPDQRSGTRRAEAVFSPGRHCVDRITGLIADARERIDVCVFTITDNRISDALADAKRRGVSLRVITDNDKAMDLGSDIDKLHDRGIPVRVDRTHHHMHHKYALFDGTTLTTGSYNWTRSAADYNQENIVITDDERLVSRFRDHFEQLWTQLEE